jgi:inosine/xanthosine triphosphatase
MLVAIGSDNPVKVAAVKTAFKKVWPRKKFSFVGIKVNSGVSHQPMSDEETIKGAKNRAKRAMRLAEADFGVGLEGGIQKIDCKWFDCGWIVVVDKKGNVGIGSSIRMHVPPKMMKHVHKGMEIGLIDDLFFKVKDSKKGKGHFGLMSKNLITREKGYVDGSISALIRFINSSLFD